MGREKGKCTLFYCCFRHYQMLAYNISACEVCMIYRKPTEACKNPLPIAESRTVKSAMVTLKIQPDCSTVHDTFLWASIYVRSHLGCGTDSVSSVFCRSHKYFKDAKVMQINRILKMSLIWHVTLNQPRKTTGILTNVFSTSGPNLVALAWTGDELSHGQAQNGVSFDFEVKFDLEGHSQSPPKTIGILTKVFYTYGPNLVILAWTGDELSHGQTWWRTDGRTQATTIPEGQYWPRVIKAPAIRHNLPGVWNIVVLLYRFDPSIYIYILHITVNTGKKVPRIMI